MGPIYAVHAGATISGEEIQFFVAWVDKPSTGGAWVKGHLPRGEAFVDKPVKRAANPTLRAAEPNAVNAIRFKTAKYKARKIQVQKQKVQFKAHTAWEGWLIGEAEAKIQTPEPPHQNQE